MRYYEITAAVSVFLRSSALVMWQCLAVCRLHIPKVNIVAKIESSYTLDCVSHAGTAYVYVVRLFNCASVYYTGYRLIPEVAMAIAASGRCYVEHVEEKCQP